jgi:hypothetical protein
MTSLGIRHVIIHSAESQNLQTHCSKTGYNSRAVHNGDMALTDCTILAAHTCAALERNLRANATSKKRKKQPVKISFALIYHKHSGELLCP